MSTTPYKRKTPIDAVERTCQFARLINKPTQEWASKDIRRYIRWLWKQSP